MVKSRVTVTIYGADDIDKLHIAEHVNLIDGQHYFRSDGRMVVWASVDELRAISRKFNDLAKEAMMREIEAGVARVRIWTDADGVDHIERVPL